MVNKRIIDYFSIQCVIVRALNYICASTYLHMNDICLFRYDTRGTLLVT